MQASPSKARADAIEAHSWSVVESWLAGLYRPGPIPTFERNGTTLKALQALMGENLAADRIRRLVWEAKCEEVFAHHRRQQLVYPPGAGDDSHDLLDLLETSCSSSSQSALASLARSCVALGCAAGDPSSSVLASLRDEILNIPRQTFALESQLSSITALTSSLEDEHAQTRRSLSNSASRGTFQVEADVDTDADHANPVSGLDPSRLHAETLQHQRETKQLALKSAEYRDRVASLERHAAAAPNLDGPTVADLAAEEDVLARKRRQIDTLEEKLRVFHGLPPDLEASRAEVRRAQSELDALKSRRDEAFQDSRP